MLRTVKKMKQFDEIQGFVGKLWLELSKKVIFNPRSK